MDGAVVTVERRAEQRWIPRTPELSAARIRPGSEAQVLNCSTCGLFVSTPMRLLPGRRCTVAWPAMRGTPAVTGAVVRSEVGKLDAKAGVSYHAAVQIDGPASFLREHDTRVG